MKQIVAMGGGGFSMEPENPALDQFVLSLVAKPTPKVCFLGQASGDHGDYHAKFHQAFNQLNCQTSHLSLFLPHTAEIEDYLLAQDLIYVGGGNTKSMLAIWREWGLDRFLLRACENGTVLAGISAGAICWFEQGSTDSIPGSLTALNCLGYLKGSCTPHYDGEAERRPSLRRLIGSGELIAGYAFDDGAAGHFVDGELKQVVSSRPNARGYWVERAADDVQESPLDTRYLLADS